jgi:hypothetical protein
MDSIEVVADGGIEREDRCAVCHGPMLYRMDAHERPIAMFCGSLQDGCSEALREIPLEAA